MIENDSNVGNRVGRKSRFAFRGKSRLGARYWDKVGETSSSFAVALGRLLRELLPGMGVERLPLRMHAR